MPSQEEFEASKTDRELFGVFKEPPSIHVCDPFVTPSDKTGRFSGKQFGCPFQPKGKGLDAMINKMPLTVPGDIYIESSNIQRMLSERMGPPPGKAFMPSNPGPRSMGSGSLYGVFGPANTLLDTDPLSRGADGEAKDSKKEGESSVKGRKKIYASPAKKGTYGFPVQDRTIGGSKFEFIPDEFEHGRAMERELRKEARQKFQKAFVSTGRTGKGIVPITYATVPGPDRKPEKDTTEPKAKPWRYSNPPQKGPGHGTINKLVYIASPIQQAPYVARGGSSTKSFKPAGGYHSRLSMWAPNPYRYEARPAPDNDLSLLG